MTAVNECENCKMFALVKELIDEGRLCDGGIQPQLGRREYADGCRIQNEFIENTELRLAMFGTTNWGGRQHYIYRHGNGKLYTFCAKGFVETVEDISFLHEVNLDPVDPFDAWKPDEEGDGPYYPFTIAEGAGVEPEERKPSGSLLEPLPLVRSKGIMSDSLEALFSSLGFASK